jgi:branched-chain amino acid transport system substrate-binding protein
MRFRRSRRTFLKSATAAAVVAGFPRTLRAQPPAVKIGVVHPVTGPLAEPGQSCRLGAQMAADAINAAGGIKALNGARLELLLGDTQTRPDVGRTEAERVIDLGARMLMGSFDSGSTAAMVPVVQQRRVPFLVDIAVADVITASVARSVKEGQDTVQYVYRNFPTGSSFGRRAVQYFDEIFKEAGVAPKRVVVMHANDLFGQDQTRGFLAAHTAAAPAWDIVDVISFPEPPSGLSTEVSRAKALRPDIIAPITRPASAQLLLPELARQRVEVMGIVGPGSPGLYEAGQLAVLKGHLEHVMTSVPWPNVKNARTRQVAEEYVKRSEKDTGRSRTFATDSGYSYDGMMLIVDILERARSTDPDRIVEAMRATRYTGGLMVYAGPVVFNEVGDNPNAVPAMIQIQGQKPVVVWPREAAIQKFVFPRPKA